MSKHRTRTRASGQASNRPRETCHYLMSTPDGEQLSVSGSKLPVFLRKYGSKAGQQNNDRQP